ncbi:MAG: hypothetical protein CMF62_01810 [Magnetococcales bacterium]|nr:hypothetical protein [Magnetococcales bacterium]|tara:strand:- start:88764 stop:89780 length:1017 start_codon:yes stop_codon:yes gene_type:complete
MELAREQPFDEKFYLKGISRRLINDEYEYYYIKNDKEVSKKDKNRIKQLKLPPNWEKVWISSDSETPIQATGIDGKGRKQYRYNNQHIERAEKEKFLRLSEFLESIPKLQKKMDLDNKLNPYDLNRVISTMLTLVKELHIRVGKECYARLNKSYGITSLKKIHLSLSDSQGKLRFKGKSNKRLSYSTNNKEVLKHLKLLLLLEGDKLFQYVDENGKVRRVTDTDLNQYIQQYMGEKFTCKDFRTYAANHHFIRNLLNETNKRKPKNTKIIKKNITEALKKTAFYLRHTKAISKKSYVMNFTLNLYENDPKYFINRKDQNPNKVLSEILKLYKKEVLNI